MTNILESIALASLPTPAEEARIKIIVALARRRERALGRPRSLVAVGREYEALGMPDTANDVYREAGSPRRAQRAERPKRAVRRHPHQHGPDPETLDKLRRVEQLVQGGRMTLKAAAAEVGWTNRNTFFQMRKRWGNLLEAQP